MSKNYFISGEFNVTCDVCSKKIKAHEAKHRWDGFIVCSDDYEVRHSQDFVRARQDKITVPFSRPRPPDVFVPEFFIIYLDERLTITESIHTQIVYNITTLDSILVTDSLDVSIVKGILDILALSDSVEYIHESVPGVTDGITAIDIIYINSVFGSAINGATINSTTLG